MKSVNVRFNSPQIPPFPSIVDGGLSHLNLKHQILLSSKFVVEERNFVIREYARGKESGWVPTINVQWV